MLGGASKDSSEEQEQKVEEIQPWTSFGVKTEYEFGRHPRDQAVDTAKEKSPQRLPFRDTVYF